MRRMAQGLAASLLVVMALLAAGCHTASGFGQDVQAGGKAIQKAAN